MAGALRLLRLVIVVILSVLATCSHARKVLQQQSVSYPYNMLDLTNFVTKYNLTNNQASELESIIRHVSAVCEVPVRVQLDYLYTMLAFVETASGFQSQAEVTDIGLLFPDTNDEITSTAIFRSKSLYTGRGDGWIADSTTGSCKGVDCRGSGASSLQMASEAAGEGLPTVAMDDLQELPTSLDRNASAPDMMQLVSSEMPPPQLLMYYRYDLFSEHQLVLPATWSDLADWAALLNGTIDADGDGRGDWALCLDTRPACKSGFLLMAIMTSVVQPATEYGAYFEPETMKPLVRSQGFVYALSVFRRLASYSAPTGTDIMSCRAYEPGFFAGQCLVTLSFDQMRVALAPLADAAASSAEVIAAPSRGVLPRDALGVAPLPGSEVLLNRTSGELVPCGVNNCPNAVTASCAMNGNFQALRTCRVNRAPLIASMNYEMVVASYAPTGARSLMTDMVREMTATLQTWAKALLQTLVVPPGDSTPLMGDGSASRHRRQRVSRLRILRSTAEDSDNGRSLGTAGAAAANVDTAAEAAATSLRATALMGNRTTTVEPLTKFGYSSVEVARFLAVYWGSLLGNDTQVNDPASVQGPQRNVVHELRIRGSSYFTNIFSRAAMWVLRDGVEPEVASRWAASETKALLELVAENQTRLAFKYCKDIGWNGDNGIGGSSGNDGRNGRLAPSRNSGLNGGQLTAVIVAPICAVSLALVGTAVAAVALRRRRWASGPKAMGPPGPGLGTSLILTDIQNSTVLWESLPADIMDAALRCHHDVVRRLLSEHRGYESATEGDAFILAFHSSEDAARYAVAAQEMLVTAPWPEEMLSHPDCEVVWMAPNRADPVACLSYVNRELLAATSRAAAACRAEGEAGAAAGSPSPSPQSHVSMLAGWWRRTVACCGCIAVGEGNSRRSTGCNGPAAGGKEVATSNASEKNSDGSGAASREQDGAVAASDRASNGGGHGGSDGGGGGGNLNKAIDGLMRSRITVANKKRILVSPGDEASVVGSAYEAPAPTFLAGRGSGGGGGGGGDGNTLLNAQRHLHRLSPLVKSPSDIRSYMTDIETDVELLNHPDQPVNNADLPIDRADSIGTIIVPRLKLPSLTSDAVKTSSLPSLSSKGPLRGAAPAGGTQTPRAASRLQQSSSAPGNASSSVGDGFSVAGDEGGETPTLSPLLGLSSSTAASTLIEALRQGWRRVPPPAGCGVGGEASGGDGVSDGTALEAEPLLIYRGMRVRMGIHTGADLGEVSLNKATGRTQYSGVFMTVAKAVCDAAHGGQVLISPAAFKRLPPGSLAKTAFLLHMGEHLLAEGDEAGALYQLLPYSLSCRLPTFSPLRTHEYQSLGLPDAPVGRVTVVFMYVIGAQTLLAWNPVVAADALAIFHDTVAEQIHGTDGYVVELVDGLCLAGFRFAADALLWSLRCGRLLLSAPWSEELLEHELCEEVSLLVQSEPIINNGGGGLAGFGGGQWQTRTPWLANPAAAPGSGSGNHQHVPLHHQQTLPPLHQHSPPPQQQPRAYTLPRAPVIRHKTLMRGLRLKVGMDIGFVADSINATTGRMAYRGRTMNRAARIASKALAGQVHCSGAVWEAAAERLAALARALPGTPGYTEEEVAATSLGLQSLKGVMEKIEVLSVSYKGTALTPEEVAMVAKRAPRQSTGSSAAISSSYPNTSTNVTNSSGSNAFSALATALSMGHVGATPSGSRAVAAAAAAAALGNRGRSSLLSRSSSGLPNASPDRLSPVNPQAHQPLQPRLSFSMHAPTCEGGTSISENGVDNEFAAAAAAVASNSGGGAGASALKDGISAPDEEQNSSGAPASEAAPCERTRSLYLLPASPLSSPVGEPSCAPGKGSHPTCASARGDVLKDSAVCAAFAGHRQGSCDSTGKAPAVSIAHEAAEVQMSGSYGSFRSCGNNQHIVVHSNPLAATTTDAPAVAAATSVPLEGTVTSNPASIPSKPVFSVLRGARQNGLIAPHCAPWTSKGPTAVMAAANVNSTDQGSAAAVALSRFGTFPCQQAERTSSSLLPLPPAPPAMAALSSPASLSPTTPLAGIEKGDH